VSVKGGRGDTLGFLSHPPPPPASLSRGGEGMTTTTPAFLSSFFKVWILIKKERNLTM